MNVYVIYPCQKLLEVGADQSSYFISVQKMEMASRVSVIVNNTICITVKGAAALTRVHMHTYRESVKGKREKHSCIVLCNVV